MTDNELDTLKTEEDFWNGPSLEVRHVYPLMNLSEHDIESPNCPCGPLLEVHEDVLLVIHREWDKSGRTEFYKEVHGEVVL